MDFDDTSESGVRYLHIDGPGRPILLLHGLGNSSDYWFKLIPLLARRRAVIAVDIPGFGESDRPPDPSLPSVAALIANLVNDVVGNDVDIVAHSLGAYVALAIAGTPAIDVRTCALISGPPAIGDEVLRSASAAIRHPGVSLNLLCQFIGASIPLTNASLVKCILRHDVARALLLWPYIALPREVDWEDLARAVRHNQGGWSAIRILKLRKSTSLKRLLESWRGDTILLRGECDRLVRDEDFAILRRRLNVRSEEVIPGVGHWAMLENPEELSYLLLERL